MELPNTSQAPPAQNALRGFRRSQLQITEENGEDGERWKGLRSTSWSDSGHLAGLGQRDESFVNRGLSLTLWAHGRWNPKVNVSHGR